MCVVEEENTRICLGAGGPLLSPAYARPTRKTVLCVENLYFAYPCVTPDHNKESTKGVEEKFGGGEGEGEERLGMKDEAASSAF